MIYLSQISKPWIRNIIIGSEDIPSSHAYAVDLHIQKPNGSSWTTILTIHGVCTETLHKAAGDKWYFYGAQELLREYYKDNNLFLENIRFDYYAYDLESENNDYHYYEPASDVLFTDSYITGLWSEQYCRAHFLESGNVGYIIPISGVTPTLNLNVFSDELNAANKIELRFNTHYFDSNGQVQNYTGRYMLSGAGKKSQNILFTLPPSASYSDVIKIVFTCGSRTYTFYNLLAPHTETFRFRNRWNVQEVITLPCSIESNPKTELELATCNDIDVPYDIEHTTEHTLKTSAMPVQFYDSLLQLLRSHSVEYLTPSGYEPIHFKEYELPRTTNPNDQITLEATFQINDRTETIYLT